MKKSKEFNNILDMCLERLLVQGETIEQCLQSYPEHAAELEPLLQTAVAAKKALAIQPHPEFKAKARYQFHSALQEVKPKRMLPFLGWQPRWATVVAIVLVFLLAGGGTVAAASGSMPDSPFYPVKLAAEQVQLTLTISNIGKAELYAKLADRRVVEIIRMASKSKPEQIERTAQRLDAYLTKIADLASMQTVMGVDGGAIAPAAEEAPVVREAPLLPEQAKTGKEARLKIDRRARLKATVVQYAINHPERLRAVLEKASESAKPALLRAIAVSKTGYEKALKALD